MQKNKKKIIKINTSKVVIAFSFLLIIVISLYTVLNSDSLNSKNIKIKGNKYVKSDDIIKILEINDDKNIFRYNIKDMENKLLTNKYIDNVKIKRILPNTLDIDIIETEIVGSLYNKKEYSYIDIQGNFIDKVDEDIKDNNIITVHVDYELTNQQYIKFKNEENRKELLHLLENIKKESIYKKIDKIDMTKTNTLNMYTKDNTTILLNIDEDLQYNISRLSKILLDLQNKKQKGGEIDLSIDKYALYRP